MGRVCLCLVSICFLLVSVSYGQSFYGTNDPEVFKAGRDAEFKDKAKSPLKPGDFENFVGLSYFAYDKKYEINADYAESADDRYFLMPTSSGTAKRFRKTGTASFQFDGKSFVLEVYQSELIDTDPELKKEYGHAYFVPFTDDTNGATTYKGGRYLSVPKPEAGKLVVNFNLAYNPSCAYGSDRYSCPIPPKSNDLKFPVEAGEKAYKSTER
ncbi:MAG: DUF1684 domain-containing protein [Pyrinomonadaceae bacterium]